MGSYFFVEQCRQAKISYSTKLKADVCFQYNNGVVIRENYNFGSFPVMLKVCGLISVYVCVFSYGHSCC